MTVSEMIRVYKMDMDQFETYALQRGFKFYEVIDKNRVHGFSYSKGYNKQTKYLTFYDTFFDDGIVLIYQTAEINEYLNFKNQMNNYGFILTENSSFNSNDNDRSSQFKVYRNKYYEIQVYTIPEHYNSNGQFQNVKYEISISKL
jgi:hypothetical protein